MIIYIAKNIERYNTYLQNLIEAYKMQGIKVIVGYENFIYGNLIPDFIHFHWAESLLGNMNFDQEFFFRRLEFFKNHKTKFIYTAHNILPRKNLNKVDFFSFFSKFLQYIDLFVHHGSVSIDIYKEKFSLLGKEHIVCHHGDYLRDMKDFKESQDTAREALHLPRNKKTILVFGILQFKNLDFVNAVFKKVNRNINDCMLVLAGIRPIFKYEDMNRIYSKINNNLLNKLRNKRRVINKRFSNYETFLLFKSSNIIFLPHNSGLTTGIIPMSATIGKPFVYPDIGNFEEEAKHCKCEKYEPSNVEEAYNAIAKLIEDPIATFDNTEWLANNSWEEHVKLILSKIHNTKFS